MTQKHGHTGVRETQRETATTGPASGMDGEDKGFTHGQPALGQRARELQPYGEVSRRLPVALGEQVRRASAEALN